MKPHKHATLWMQIANDAAKTDKFWELYEFKFMDCWVNIQASPHGSAFNTMRRKPNADELLAEMIKPKLKPVDMSVLVRSGIDCTFSNIDLQWEGWLLPLAKITEAGNFVDGSEGIWDHCKPRMNYWFSVKNVPDGALCELEGAGFEFEWEHVAQAFKITGIHKNRCWPWELNS